MVPLQATYLDDGQRALVHCPGRPSHPAGAGVLMQCGWVQGRTRIPETPCEVGPFFLGYVQFFQSPCTLLWWVGPTGRGRPLNQAFRFGTDWFFFGFGSLWLQQPSGSSEDPAGGGGVLAAGGGQRLLAGLHREDPAGHHHRRLHTSCGGLRSGHG